MKELTQELLKECVCYDEETGEFLWLKRPLHHFLGTRDRTASHIMNRSNSQFSSKKAGFNHHSGYVHIIIFGVTYTQHRLAWLYVYGELPGFVDHINGNRSDNRITNLRNVTQTQNNQNSKKRKDNTTGVTGVTLRKSGTYRAVINVNKKRISLGSFKTIKEAEYARKTAILKYGFSPTHGRDA